MAKGSTKLQWGMPAEPPQGELLKLLEQAPDGEPSREARAELLVAIHEKIIPQLVLAHRAEPYGADACKDARPPPTAEEVAQFADIAVDEDLPTALAFVQAIASEGVSLEVVLLHLIAPAARLLGEQWQGDTRTFTEVTIGLGTLQQVVHILGPSYAPGLTHRGLVLLVAAPREQHTLGIYVLGEIMRRAGWGVQVAPNMTEDELISVVGSELVVMVGFSVSNEDLVRPLASLVAAVKKASLNREIAIMMGGSLDLKGVADQIGAMFCPDPLDAVRWLEHHTSFSDAVRRS
jgi:MerR family transcriptional regulator, light-induced transcriptional regulator